MEAESEFQFFEDIGTNILANEVIRHLSNLTAKECWESAKRVLGAKHALGGILESKHRACWGFQISSKIGIRTIPKLNIKVQNADKSVFKLF